MSIRTIARKAWHWIDGPMPQPKMPVRSTDETDQEYVRRCQAYLAESRAYQDQNMRLADRNIRAALVLMFVAIVISIAVPIVRALR